MRTVFDIGMYDGADTEYYLQSGFRVVAVEPNPVLVQRARERFKAAITEDRLVCVEAAITPDGAETTLNLSGDDLGSSSTDAAWVASRQPLGTIAVAGTTVGELIDTYGVPYYMKVDIEGADRWCILALTTPQRPPYVSFELRTDFEELLEHLSSIGFARFKIISQVNFRCLRNERNLRDRVSLRAIQMLGYSQPEFVRRRGRFFRVGHSSGPGPWESDGRTWLSATSVVKTWRRLRREGEHSWRWYDVHAS
jgi:FkbM family methyltransferase